VVAAGIGKAAAIYDAVSLQPVGAALQHPNWVYWSFFTADGRGLITADEDGVVRTWDLATAAPHERLRLKSPVHGAALCGNGHYLLTGTRDGLARSWQVATWKELHPAIKPGAMVWAVALSPDGRLLLTGDRDKTARLWDLNTGQPTGRAMRHVAAVTAVAFGPGGLLATGAGLGNETGGEARFWDAATCRPIGPPLLREGPVPAVVFAPDGQTLLTAGQDGVARLWPVPRPPAADRERLEVWVQVLAGAELDAAGAPRPWSAAEWQARVQELQRLGGAPG
jgi:WD40 repeat protein